MNAWLNGLSAGQIIVVAVVIAWFGVSAAAYAWGALTHCPNDMSETARRRRARYNRKGPRL